MPNAKRLRHQQAARDDLREIWNYTNRVWGRQQADLYIIQISDALSGLATGRSRGTRYSSAYKKRRVRAHVIFYRETETELTVVRVLHGRMDMARHLPN